MKIRPELQDAFEETGVLEGIEVMEGKSIAKYYKVGLRWGGLQNKSFLPLIKKYELSIGAKIETTPNDISICSEGFRIVAIMKTIENLKEIKDSRIINEFPEYRIAPNDNKMYAAKCFIYELNQNQQFDVKIQQGTCELHDNSIIEKINELLPEFYEAFDKWYNFSRRHTNDRTRKTYQ